MGTVANTCNWGSLFCFSLFLSCIKYGIVTPYSISKVKEQNKFGRKCEIHSTTVSPNSSSLLLLHQA